MKPYQLKIKIQIWQDQPAINKWTHTINGILLSESEEEAESYIDKMVKLTMSPFPDWKHKVLKISVKEYKGRLTSPEELGPN